MASLRNTLVRVLKGFNQGQNPNKKTYSCLLHTLGHHGVVAYLPFQNEIVIQFMKFKKQLLRICLQSSHSNICLRKVKMPQQLSIMLQK